MVQRSKIPWRNNRSQTQLQLSCTQNTIKKATRARRLLYPILNKRNAVPLQVRINILKTYISPVLIYAGEAWAPHISGSQWRKLQAVLTIGLRTITGMPSTVGNSVSSKSAKMATLQENIRQQTSPLFHSSAVSHFPHIRRIVQDHTQLNVNNRQPVTPKILTSQWLKLI